MRKMKFIYLTTALFLFGILLFPNFATAQEPCGTDIIQRELMANRPAYKARIQAKEKILKKYIQEASSYKITSTYDTIPVVVHVLHTGQAVGTGYNISDAQIQSSIDRLNDVFEDYDGNGTDSYIRFALAVRDPQGCTTANGINRIDATGVEDYENIGITTGTERVNLFNLSRWNTEEYLNFWVVSEINDNNGADGTQGFATQSATSHQYDGVVCMYNTTGYDPNGTIGYELKSDKNQNETFIHEVGHYLDLYHTFQGDDTNGDGSADSCPTDLICGDSGDCCSDTDVHQRTYSNVCWNNVNNSCTGNNYGDVVKNYMAYSSQDCKDRFTDDQVVRMQAVLTTGRAGLLTSVGLKTLTATEPVAACDAMTSSTGTSGNYGTGIIKITLGSWTTESGNSYEDGGYLDNWCNQLDFELNTTYSYDITLSGNYSEYIRAWIDYDNDGTFTNASELVISSSGKVTSLSGSFTTPSDATTNTSLRIRFRTSQSNSEDACHDPTYGQAEDYSIYFENHAALTASESSLSDINAFVCCESSDQTFTLSGVDLLNDVDISIANSDFEISSDGTTYSNSLTLTESSGTIQNQPVTIYTRLKSGLTIGNYNDNITITSSPATDVVIPISGKVGETDGVRGNAFNITTVSNSNFAIADSYKGITGTDSRTYEAWIKTSNNTAVFFANGINSSGEKWIIRLDSGKLRIETNGANKVGTTVIDDDAWHHVVVVLDNSTGASLDNTTLYVDGIEESISSSSNTSNSINTDDTQNLWLGIDHSNRNFSGYIDEVRVWSVARTQSQLRENMHMTLKGNETGLEAYYQFNETSGTTIGDEINGHDLTLQGSATFATSTLDVGSGSCGTVNVGSTGGSGVEVSSNDLEIDFTDGGTAPDGDLVIFRIEDQPANGSGESYEGSQHWVVRNFGNNQNSLNIESIKMTLNTSDPILVYEEVSMSLQKRASGSDGSWTIVATSATTVTPASGEMFFGTLTGFSSFSQLLVASSGMVLPVELIDFSAKRNNRQLVELDWSTASETNNKGFEIHRSYDGIDFEKIDFVEGRGTVSSMTTYQKEVEESRGAYYRLNQIDLDGYSEWGPIQFVEGMETANGFTLFPNPTKESVQLLSDKNIFEKIDFTILNVHGNKLLEVSGSLSEINSNLNQQIKKYPNGIYFILINDGFNQHTKRLVID